MPKFLIPAVIAATFAHPILAEQSCETLVSLKLVRAIVRSATLAEEGLSGSARPNTPSFTIPKRCIVKGIARPSADSEIKFEVWLPVQGWNGKYRQSGNGGWAGSIPTQSLAHAVRLGYATAGTDDGHEGGASASWAIGHPEKLIDFGYRAVHQTSVQAKAIIRAFYGTDPSRNYFVGCSDGGREALMEAQRFPEDFDGIIAGAPANYWSHHFTGFVWNEQALMKDAGSSIPPSKLPAIQNAALAACDSLDGVKDGLIEDPRVCHFDPSVLACKAADSPSCLTPPQLEALRMIYAGPKNPRTGVRSFRGIRLGRKLCPEAGQPGSRRKRRNPPIQFRFGNTYYGQAVFEDPKWDFRKLNFDSDVAFGDEKAGSVLNSYNPDLRSFRAHGGKLLQYHGWGDAAIAPMISIQYYEAVAGVPGTVPGREERRDAPGAGFLPALHGSWDGTLRRRDRSK